MRQLSKLLSFAARTLAKNSASGGIHAPLHLLSAEGLAAATAINRHAHFEGPWMTPYPFRFAVSSSFVLSCQYRRQRACDPFKDRLVVVGVHSLFTHGSFTAGLCLR
jgi:hypothetical protein